MRTVVRRRTFLAGIGILFLLSFALPAVGDWGHFFSRSARGLDAFCGALTALSHPLSPRSGLDSVRAVLMALSVLANLFFVVGWAFAAAGLRPSGRGNAAALMAWGLFSVALALLPLFWWGGTSLLIGYYLWVFAIALLAAWWWYVGITERPADPNPTTSHVRG